MNQPVAITDETAKEILSAWQSTLFRHEIQAHLSVYDHFTQLIVPVSQITKARQILFNRP